MSSIESETKQVSLEQRIVLSLPYMARPTSPLSFNRKALNTIYYLVAYCILAHIPLVGLQMLERYTRARFSLTGFNTLSVFGIARNCSFASTMLTMVCIRQQIIAIHAGRRKTDIIKDKIKLAVYLILLTVGSAIRVHDLFRPSNHKQIAYPQLSSIGNYAFKCVLFCQLLGGGVLYFFLRQYIDRWGFGDGQKFGHLVDYGLTLTEWFMGFSGVALEAGVSGYTVLAYSVLYSALIAWLYSLWYQLPLSSTVTRGHTYHYPIKYMYCDTQAIYLASLAKEFGYKLVTIVESYTSWPVSEGLKEFLQGEHSYHYNYLYGKTYLTIADILFNGFCYIGLLLLWNSATGTSAKGVSKQLVNAKYYIPGYAKTQAGICAAIAPQLEHLLLRSAIITLLVVTGGNILPLFGRITAANLLIIVTLIVDVRHQMKQEQQRLIKSGKQLPRIARWIMCL